MLRIEELCSGYLGVQVLHGVSLYAEQGECVALLGENGSGKTTICSCISGSLTPYSGRISFGERDITCLPPNKRTELGIITVPEGRHLFSRMTVRDNLLMGGYLLRNREKISHRLDYVYSLFPMLKEMEGKPSGNISGGQQQIVAMARGLMAMPKVLILDEPSVGLSPKMTEMVLETVNEIKKSGVTVIISEQNTAAVLSVADRGYVISRGSVVFEGIAGDIDIKDIK